MTIGWLVLALLVVSLAVNPIAQALMWRLKSHHQVGIGVTASLALVVLPIAAVLVALSGSLVARGGSLLSRCGRLVAAVVLEPWARPELALSLFLLAFVIARLTWGMARAWRSQSAAVRLAAGGDGMQVVVAAPQCFVFTVGLLKPRIVLSEGFLRSTPPQWRRVVLAHEEAHARGRHPLLLFIVEAISAALPLAPMRWAARVTRSGLEAVADDYATRKVGDKRIVAEVIAGMALTPVYGAIGFEGDEVRRVRRLLNAVRPRFAWMGATAIAMIAVILLFAGGHAVHCGQQSVRSLGIAQCRTGG